MLKIIKSFSASIAKVGTSFHVVGFEEEASNQALWGYGKCEGNLTYLLRIGAILNVDDVKRLVSLLEFLHQQQGKLKLRVMSQQLENTYQNVCLQHLLLLSTSQIKSLGHLHLYSFPQPIDQNEGILDKIINYEGWLLYCDWFNEELEKIPFKLDMLDLYQVEARVKDFAHEVESPFLSEFRKQVSITLRQTFNAIIALNDQAKNQKILTDGEKKLIKMRLSVQDNLHDICQSFESLIAYIQTVEVPHPELISAKNQAIMLVELIREELDLYFLTAMSWARRLLLLSLVDCYLGVTSALNGSLVHGSTAMGFALKLAVLQLVQQGKINLLVKIALNWDKAILEINRHCIKLGINEYERWLKESKEDSEFYQGACLVHQIRWCVFQNLKYFCYPFIESKTTSPPSMIELTPKWEPSYLDILPEKFVIYNRENFKPEALTPEGAQQLLSLSPN